MNGRYSLNTVLLQIHWNNLVVDSTKVVIHPDYISVLEPGTVILGNNDLALIQVNIHTVHQVSNSNRQKAIKLREIRTY